MVILANYSIVSSKPSGISVYAQNIAPYLQQLDLVFLTNAFSSTNFDCYDIPHGLSPDSGAKGHTMRLLWTQFVLPKIYKQLNADLLFSPLPEMPLYSSCEAVVMIHDVIPLVVAQKRSKLYQYFKHIVPRIAHQAKHIVCNSETTAQAIVDTYSISAAKVTPIPLAYDRAHFRLMEHLPLPQKPYFLYVGRHDRHKNLYRMITAFSQLPSCHDIEFWLVGAIDGRYTPALRQLVAELGLTDAIVFKDYVAYNELPKIINQALCLVFPTLIEGFGLPVLEAMACGTPVLTSNLSALAEIAQDAALLVDPYSTQAIADGMQQMLIDESLRRQFTSLGLQHVQKFSWQKTGESTAAVLKQFS